MKKEKYVNTTNKRVLIQKVQMSILPAGHGQEPQPLPEPIIAEYYETYGIPLPEDDTLGATDEEIHVPTDRKCRKCNKNMMANRYYICHKCKPVLEEDMGQWSYGGVGDVE